MTHTNIIVRYSFFAAISIAANIYAQKMCLIVAPVFFAIPLSIMAGSAVGLVVKFVLDKIWIFEYQHRDVAHGVGIFLRYLGTGVLTTAIFWGFELAAELLFGTEVARLTGGAAGLVLGYIVKYRLDRRVVFA